MKIEASNLIAIGGIGLVSIIVLLLLVKKSTPKGRHGNRERNVLVTLKSPDIKYGFPLASKEELCPDTHRFRFELPSSRHVLGVPIGQCIHLTARIDGELVKRSYTPTTSDDNQGYFDLIVKNDSNGRSLSIFFCRERRVTLYLLDKMSEYLNQLMIGHRVEVSGPSGNLIYRGDGLFDIRSDKSEPFQTRRIRHLGLIAGGMGITSIYQIINEICSELVCDGSSQFDVSLIFANENEDTMVLREQIEQLSVSSAGRFRLRLIVDRDNQQWKYSTGFVDETMIKAHLPAPGDDVLICVCGSASMLQSTCLPNLHRLGYNERMIITF
jgi:cytochrome-b5 reductase